MKALRLAAAALGVGALLGTGAAVKADEITMKLGGFGSTVAIDAAVGRDGRSVLDLSGVTRSDSAGLACVLAVLAQAAERGHRLSVQNMPQNMHLLASVCEVEGLMA